MKRSILVLSVLGSLTGMTGCQAPDTGSLAPSGGARDTNVAVQVQPVPACTGKAYLGTWSDPSFVDASYQQRRDNLTIDVNCTLTSSWCGFWYQNDVTIEDRGVDPQSGNLLVRITQPNVAHAECIPKGTHDCQMALWFDAALGKQVLQIGCPAWRPIGHTDWLK